MAHLWKLTAVDIFTLVQYFETNEVLEVLVRWNTDPHIDPSLFRGDLEFPFTKDMSLIFSKRYKVSRILLAHKVLLRDEIVLLRYDGNFSQVRTCPHGKTLRSHHVRLEPNCLKSCLLWSQAQVSTLEVPFECLIYHGNFGRELV